MSVRLRLLGGTFVEVNGESMPLPLDRPVSLLVYLAVRGVWVSRSELALLYRPDAAADEAYAYLRKLIFRARKFPWAQGLEATSDRLSWQVESDVSQFLAAVETRSWQEALEAYGGAFLNSETTRDAPGLAFWQDMQREALQTQWLQAAVTRAAALSSAGEHGSAAVILASVLETDPLAEENLQQYVRTLVADGREREALAAFERFRRQLDDEVGGTPLESTLVLVDSVRQQAGSDWERPRRVDIPVPVTEFVGRESELARLGELWTRPDARLVTVIGLGGSGKTRLAIEAARRFEAVHKSPALFVPLAAVTNPNTVVSAILAALRLQSAQLSEESALIDALRDTEMLLVLDNFEHLTGAAPFLLRLLEAVEGIRILVTSREPLGISGEWRFALGGLVTSPADASTGKMLSAVRLFVLRALRYNQNFAATGKTLEAITEICRMLEGLPLAIELAASWTRLLPVSELHSQLMARNLPLAAELADLPERHRSVWNVFDYTWDRLSESEREALIRLAVFPGGFTLEAASEAAGTDFKVLLSLLDRMLVRRFEEGRFVMHALVRQYAESRASEQQKATASEAHAAYYCSLLATMTPSLKGEDVQIGLEGVQADIANFEAAWTYSVEQRDFAAMENAREALDYFYYYRAHFDTARQQFGTAVAALDQPAANGNPAAARLKGLLLAQIAEKEFGLGYLDDAMVRVQSALDILREHASEVELARAQLVLANGLVKSSRYLDARPHFEEVLATALESNDDYLVGSAHNGLANVLSLADGDMNQAIEHYRASMQAHSRIGSLEGVTGALTNLGACWFDLEDFDEAERLWHKAVDASRTIGFRDREAALLSNLGALAEVQDRLDVAAERYHTSLEIRRELGARAGIATVLNNLARLAMRLDDPGTARIYAEDALGIFLVLGDTAGETQSRSYLARILLMLGRLKEAAAHVEQAEAMAVQTGSAKDMLGVLLSQALLQEAEGAIDSAVATAQKVADMAAGVSEPVRTEAQSITARLARNVA